MKTKNINILGENIEIGFCMAVELEYERITGKPFSTEALISTSSSLDLCVAVINTYNSGSAVTRERLITEASGKEVAELNISVAQALREWLEIPVTMPESEQAAEDDAEGEQAKN